MIRVKHVLVLMLSLAIVAAGTDLCARAEQHDAAEEARIHVRDAQRLLRLGHRSRAYDAWRSAEVAARRSGDAVLAALALSGLATTGPASASRESVQAQHAEAVRLARTSGVAGILASVLANQGADFGRAKQPERAEAAFREALAVVPIGDRAVRVRLLANLARLGAERGDASVVSSQIDALLGLVAGVEDDVAASEALLATLGAVLANYPRLEHGPMLERARALSAAAVPRAARTGDRRMESLSLGLQAQLDASQLAGGESLARLRHASLLARQADAPELLYRWQWALGRALASAGAPDPAIAAYRVAIAALQGVRADLGADLLSSNLTFREVYAPLYYELADLVLRRASTEPDGARRRGLLEEARATVELTKAAELEDYFQDGCVAAQQARVKRVETVAPDVAFIYPVVLRDRLELLVSHAGGVEQFTVGVSEAALVAEVRSFRQRLERRTTRQFLPHAQSLYKLVFAPMEETLARIGAKTIVTVPEGALRTVPFAAFHDGRDFLLRRFAFATTPGLDLTDPRPILAPDSRVLMSGITHAVQGFSSLPNVEPELDAVSRLFPGRVLKNGDYSAASFEKEIGSVPYSMVHIASHAQFESDPSRTFLLTYDDKLTMNRLERLIAPSRYRDQPIELLTLSACQTAAGDDRAALGLAGVAIKAGARSALASLWFVNDESSAILVSEFYSQLRAGVATKSQALQRAQLKLLADQRFNHPAYWSAFLLIGNWL